MKKILALILTAALAVLLIVIIISQPHKTETPTQAETEKSAQSQGSAPEFPAPTTTPTTAAAEPPYPQGAKLTAPPQPGPAATGTPLSWSPRAKDQAIRAATDLMGVLAKPETRANRTAFNKALEGRLTEPARKLWARADPSKLQLNKVRGPALLEAGWQENPYWAWASVPANDGTWRLHLHRTPTDPAWKVDSMQVPGPR